MNKSILTLFFSCFALISFGQRSFNMTLESEVYPSNIPQGFPEEFNDIWGYAANGREYAIFGSTQGTYFVDVTDPQNPVEVDFELGFNTSASSYWRDFKTYGHYAYGVGDVTGHTLQIFDLQFLPDSVVKVYDNSEFTTNAHNIHVNNDRLYLISNMRGGTRYPIDILDISNPEVPVHIGGIVNNGNVTGSYSNAHDIYVKNDTVYLSVYFSSTNNGLHVFDMVDPQNPILLGSLTSYPGVGVNHSSWMNAQGTHLIMADETYNSPLKMVDITDLTNMQAVSVFEAYPGSMAHNAFIRDSLAYISYYHEGVQIYNIADPLNPVRVGYFHTDTTVGQGNYNPSWVGVWGVYPFLPSGNIIATDIRSGLFVMSYQPEIDTTTIDTTVSFLNQNKLSSDIQVYPNPSKGIFKVKIENETPLFIHVYSLDGQKVSTMKNSRNYKEIDLDLSGQENGMYIIEVQYINSRKRLKIFKE